MSDVLSNKKREEKLRSIWRYSMFEVMFYRTNVWLHTNRVSWIVEKLAPITKRTIDKFDPEKAKILALVHDDAEMVTGDVQLGHKEKMSKQELAEIERDEERAIEQLASEYPREVGGYVYRNLLLHALKKDCIEAQIVSYADKLDAYCEVLHEIFGGNISMIRSLLLYEKILNRFPEKFPRIKRFLKYQESPLTNFEMRLDPYRAHRKNYVGLNKPHTRKSIKIKTEFPVYDEWRRIAIDHLGEEGVKLLTTQKEFLQK